MKENNEEVKSEHTLENIRDENERLKETVSKQIQVIEELKKELDETGLCWPGGPPGIARCAFLRIRLLRPWISAFALFLFDNFRQLHNFLFVSYIIPDEVGHTRRLFMRKRDVSYKTSNGC